MKKRKQEESPLLKAYLAIKNDSTEQAIIGSLLLDPENNSFIFNRLSPEDFINPLCSAVYNVISSLYFAGEQINIAMVAERGKISAKLLADMANYYTNSGTIEKLVESQEMRGWLKKYISTCEKVLDTVINDGEDLDELLGRVLSFWEQPFKYKQISESEEIKDIIDDLKEQLFLSERIPSGYNSLDAYIDGFGSGELILIASRPSVGKTALVINLIWNLLKNKQPCGFFSIEMDRLSILIRLFSLVFKTPIGTIRTSLRSDPNFFDIIVEDFKQKLTCPFLLNCDGSLTIRKLSQIATAWKNRYNIKAIFIDYIQLLKSNYGSDSRAIEMSLISRDLKSLARDLNIPVIAVSQLNRAIENRADKLPQLSDLRESGALEQDADVVIMLSREDYYEQPTNNEPVVPLEIYIRKNRNGPLGKVALQFEKPTNIIYELEEVSFDET